MVKTFFIINIRLSCLGNPCHCLNSLNGVLADCRLARKHNCRCAVINSVCNICNLGSCRARIFNHWFKHLSCRYNDFTCLIDLFDNHFLNGRDFFKRNFNAHIAAGNHNAVGNANNLVDIFNTLWIFNFCDDFNIFPSDSLEIVTHNRNIRCRAAEWCGDEIKIHLLAVRKVIHILLWKIRHIKIYAGYIDALVICNEAAVNNSAYNIGGSDLINFHWNKAVINKDCCAVFNIARQTVIVYKRFFFCAHTWCCCEGESVALVNNDTLRVLKITESDFRTFCIKEGSNRQWKFVAELYNFFKSFCMLLILTMAEVESCNIHTGEHHLLKNFFVIRGRAYGAYNFSLCHFLYPLPQ